MVKREPSLPAESCPTRPEAEKRSAILAVVPVLGTSLGPFSGNEEMK